MTWFLTVFYGFLCILILLKTPFFRNSGLSAGFLVTAFLAKIAAGFAYYLLYLYYTPYQGTSDALRFFDDSGYIFNAFHSSKTDYFSMITGIGDDHYYYQKYYKDILNWYRMYQTELFNDNRTVIRFNALVRLVSWGAYPVHILFANFLSFAGLTGLYRFFTGAGKPRSGRKNPGEYFLAFLIFFFPSLVFWGSGVSKEGLSLFGTGIFLFFAGKFFRNELQPGISLVFLLIALYFMVFLKIYILLLLLPLGIAWFWARSAHGPAVHWKYLLVLAGCLLVVVNLHMVFPGFRFTEILAGKQKDFYAVALYTYKDPLSIVPDLDHHFSSLAGAILPAFLNAVTGPFVLKQTGMLQLAGFLDNLLLLLLMLIPFFFHTPLKNRSNLFFFSLLFFAMIFVLVGLISPLPGAIMRYRIMALPFLFNALRLIIDWERLTPKKSSETISSNT